LELSDLLSVEDVAEALGITPRSLHTALYRLKHDGQTAHYKGYTFQKVGKAGGKGSWVAVKDGH
jgi:Mn-dependent DtxR family transcriptional regulator